MLSQIESLALFDPASASVLDMAQREKAAQ